MSNSSASSSTSKPFPKFGNQIPFCEPYWYQGYHSPYYTENHVKFRSLVRDFVEKEIKPNVDKWIKEGYPVSLHKRAYELGISGMLYDPELGGTKTADFDAFFELIATDESTRAGGGMVLGQLAINSMALPPIINAGSEEMKKRVVTPVVQGDKSICLAISEPYAGSDVSNIRTTAVLQGDHYIVNGTKKWITGGTMGDFFTVAVRTGEPGMMGISLLLLEREMEGIHIRKMDTQFDTSHSTTFIEFNDVKVPQKNLIGEENAGFMLLMTNFNHERFVIAVSACRNARICYEEAIMYSLVRETFGKKLIQHQLVRFKLAEMARQIEALHDNCERIAYQFSKGVGDAALGGQCAMSKVQASKTFEYCAREASQIFGGNSIVKEGRGKIVERLYREVRASAIPGGSEEILLDFTMRQAASKANKILQQPVPISSKL